MLCSISNPVAVARGKLLMRTSEWGSEWYSDFALCVVVIIFLSFHISIILPHMTYDATQLLCRWKKRMCMYTIRINEGKINDKGLKMNLWSGSKKSYSNKKYTQNKISSHINTLNCCLFFSITVIAEWELLQTMDNFW